MVYLRSIFRHNLVILSVFVLISLIIGFVTFNFFAQMVNSEIGLSDKNQITALNNAKNIVENRFISIKSNIVFLSKIPSLKVFSYGNFKNVNQKDNITKSFLQLMSNHQELYRMRILDSSGKEVFRVINSSYDSKQIKDKETFELTDVTTPLIDTKGVRKGSLVSTISIFNMLSIIPGQVFFINNNGDKVTLNPDKSIRVSNTKHNIKGRVGKAYLSATESLHFQTANITSKVNLLMGIATDEMPIKSAVYERATIPIILLTLFVCLIILLAYFNVTRFKELARAQKIIIHSLADTTEWRDKTTGRHLQATKAYVKALTKKLRYTGKFKKTINKNFLNDIVDAAPLHDIGKVGIEDAVLLKPGKLTEEEFETMKNHVYIGKQLLQSDIEKFSIKQTFFKVAKNICAYHHEKYNGKGYIGIKGDKIPLEARIFAICDVYDALRSKRHYKDEMSHEEAVDIIASERGNHFDPDVVDAFMDCHEYFFEISKSNSNS